MSAHARFIARYLSELRLRFVKAAAGAAFHSINSMHSNTSRHLRAS
ncbi:hypothetical protein SBC1_42960 (plasmid) [Caballeronia sp. SBC1]|nr:hypothetical protein SBC2_44970 [Caballeronia sp. SBC2]QIN64256.1 hypothetical protein SBC1_42960 [Caballeronia sp. SBC1]